QRAERLEAGDEVQHHHQQEEHVIDRPAPADGAQKTRIETFGREYNVSFLAPLGLSKESEASADDVAKLIEQIKGEHVKAY
ncbi:hypothetical protein ACCS53_38965, partial [Rhizobium ruizarguesonis]